MSRSNWRDGIEQTQLAILQHPDACFVCRRAVEADCPTCLIRAYGDAARQRRIAVVCGRDECLRALEDQRRDLWGAFFGALMAWPGAGIAPLGPYWQMPRAYRFTFRTDPRRTLYSS